MENQTVKKFYPEIREHCSPSSLSTWYNSPSAFIKNYFVGDRVRETHSMSAGKRIHALIEGGFLGVNRHFSENEITVEIMLGDVKVLGTPDSFGLVGGEAHFVDYKTGKENLWDASKLSTDIKMKTTAWLVWKKLGCPKTVCGAIEYIPVIWDEDAHEIRPTGEPSVVAAEYCYTSGELEDYTKFILKVIDEVNEEYEKWLNSSDAFINQDDVLEYGEITAQIAELEAAQEILKQRIGEQMNFGSKSSIKTDVGTFYFSERATYNYPSDLSFVVKEEVYTLEESEKVSAGAKAAKQNFEMQNEPVSISRSLGFKPTTSGKVAKKK